MCFETIANSTCVSAEVKSANATAMQKQVLGRVHTQMEQQVRAVDEALRQNETTFMDDLDAKQQVELFATWVLVRERRDKGLEDLDEVSMSGCNAIDAESEGYHTHSQTIIKMVETLARLKTQHDEMQQIEQQMATATPCRDWAPLVGQLHKLRKQRVQRPRILCSHAVSSRTGQGLLALRRALAGLMEDTRLFAHVGAKVPLNYSMLERLAHEGREKQPSTPLLYRGNVTTAKLDANNSTISSKAFCTVRSRQQCPLGSKAYYELVILSKLHYLRPKFGFASAAFISQFGPSTHDCPLTGVGDDAASWAVDGICRVKWNAGKQQAYECQWKKGDVIGLACDLQKMQMLVSVNGSFLPPNGFVFDLAPDAVRSGLFAAYSSTCGTVGYNLGETPFKYDPPAADYCAFVEFALNQVRDSVLFAHHAY